MRRLLNLKPSKKNSQAMARCIVTGFAGSVLTYIIWRAVQVLVTEVPLSFHLTCGLVLLVTTLATGSALYRLAIEPAVPLEKSPVKGVRRMRKTPHGVLVSPVAFGKADIAWQQRN